MPSAQRWYLGLLLSLLNCALSSVGVTMQRKAYLLSAAAPAGDGGGGQRMSRAHAAMLYCGIVLYVLAAVPDIYAYMVAPQVVPTAVACFRLVAITALAHCFLGEGVRSQEVLGMLACSAGTFLCLYFGPSTHSRKDEPLERHAFPPAVVAYICLGLAALCALLVVEHVTCRLHRPVPDGRSKLSYAALPLATGLAFALEKVFNTEMGHLEGPGSLGEFVRHLPRVSPAWWCAVAGVVSLGLVDFHLNLRAAKRMPVQVFQPCAFALGTSLQYAQSIAIFGEFASLSPVHKVLSVGGTLLSLAGALYIKPPKFSLLFPRLAQLAQQAKPASDAPPARELLSDEERCEAVGGPTDHIEIVPAHFVPPAPTPAAAPVAPRSCGTSLETPLRLHGGAGEN